MSSGAQGYSSAGNFKSQVVKIHISCILTFIAIYFQLAPVLNSSGKNKLIFCKKLTIYVSYIKLVKPHINFYIASVKRCKDNNQRLIFEHFSVRYVYKIIVSVLYKFKIVYGIMILFTRFVDIIICVYTTRDQKMQNIVIAETAHFKTELKTTNTDK